MSYTVRQSAQVADLQRYSAASIVESSWEEREEDYGLFLWKLPDFN